MHFVVVYIHARVTYNSYIPQTETKQHEPEGRMLFYLGNVSNLLYVNLSNPMSHPLSPPPIQFCYLRSKIWLQTNIQQTLYTRVGGSKVVHGGVYTMIQLANVSHSWKSISNSSVEEDSLLNL